MKVKMEIRVQEKRIQYHKRESKSQTVSKTTFQSLSTNVNPNSQVEI